MFMPGGYPTFDSPASKVKAHHTGGVNTIAFQSPVEPLISVPGNLRLFRRSLTPAPPNLVPDKVARINSIPDSLLASMSLVFDSKTCFNTPRK